MMDSAPPRPIFKPKLPSHVRIADLRLGPKLDETPTPEPRPLAIGKVEVPLCGTFRNGPVLVIDGERASIKLPSWLQKDSPLNP
jgi:hypothetical protein